MFSDFFGLFVFGLSWHCVVCRVVDGGCRSPLRNGRRPGDQPMSEQIHATYTQIFSYTCANPYPHTYIELALGLRRSPALTFPPSWSSVMNSASCGCNHTRMHTEIDIMARIHIQVIAILRTHCFLMNIYIYLYTDSGTRALLWRLTKCHLYIDIWHYAILIHIHYIP